jgi:hypothetical protein
MHEEAKSGRSSKRKEVLVERGALVDSPTPVTPPSAEDLPPYGAQYRQDALWKSAQSRCDNLTIDGSETDN